MNEKRAPLSVRVWSRTIQKIDRLRVGRLKNKQTGRTPSRGEVIDWLVKKVTGGK